MKYLLLFIALFYNSCDKDEYCVCKGENSFEIHSKTDMDNCYLLLDYNVVC